MSAWKLRGEMGHGTEQMIETRYGRYAKYRAKRPVLEYRWDEWKDAYGERLLAGLSSLLSPGERACLGVLAARPQGLTLAEWQRTLQPETEPILPGRLLQLGLAAEKGSEAEPRFCVTEDGFGVLAATGTTPAGCGPVPG